MVNNIYFPCDNAVQISCYTSYACKYNVHWFLECRWCWCQVKRKPIVATQPPFMTRTSLLNSVSFDRKYASGRSSFVNFRHPCRICYGSSGQDLSKTIKYSVRSRGLRSHGFYCWVSQPPQSEMPIHNFYFDARFRQDIYIHQPLKLHCHLILHRNVLFFDF